MAKKLMVFHKKTTAFTLLELIIAIVVVGVLSGLALPRFFGMIEFSRAKEAFDNTTPIRKSMERCYVAGGRTYVNCDFSNLDFNDPSSAINSHFTYTINDQSADGYSLVVTRNNADNGDGSSTITITQTAASVLRVGTGSFAGIQ